MNSVVELSLLSLRTVGSAGHYALNSWGYGISTPEVAAVYAAGATLSSVAIEKTIEIVSSAYELSDVSKISIHLVSLIPTLVVGHLTGQVAAQRLCHQRVAVYDAVKLYGAALLNAGVISVLFGGAVAIGIFGLPKVHIEQ